MFTQPHPRLGKSIQSKRLCNKSPGPAASHPRRPAGQRGTGVALSADARTAIRVHLMRRTATRPPCSAMPASSAAGFIRPPLDANDHARRRRASPQRITLAVLSGWFGARPGFQAGARGGSMTAHGRVAVHALGLTIAAANARRSRDLTRHAHAEPMVAREAHPPQPASCEPAAACAQAHGMCPAHAAKRHTPDRLTPMLSLWRSSQSPRPRLQPNFKSTLAALV